MKHIFFFIMVLLLVQPCSFAQNNKKLTAKIFTKSEDILKAIVSSHDPKNSNDSERMIITKKILENGYVLESRMGQYWNGTDWENSSKDIFTYTPEGLKTVEINQLWNNGAWENSRRFLTAYFLNDLVSLLEEQAWNGTDWENSYEYVSLYSDVNRLTEYDVQQWNGAAWDSLYKTTYAYSNSGNLETELDLTWNGTGWDNSYRYTYQYNALDNVSDKLEEQWMEGEWKNSIKNVYSYNSQNQLELDASFWWPDTAWKESVEIFYGYDGYGNVNDMLTKFWESEELGLQNKYHITYEYLPGTGIETKAENQEWNLQQEQWINTWRDLYTYDGENVIQNHMMEVWDGSTWMPGSQDKYTYDENGNLDVLLSQYRDGMEWVNSFKASHIWQFVTSVETESPASLPLAYSLEQNYPNPFNPCTKINYSVPVSSQIRIIVYDILGNEIETLVNEEKPAGTYQLTWNATNLASGIYFYRLQAGNLVQIKKMILMK